MDTEISLEDSPAFVDPLRWLLVERPCNEQEKQLLKARLLPTLWTTTTERDIKSADAFIEYYLAQRVLVEVHGLNLKTHQDLLDLITYVRQRSHVPRAELLTQLNNDLWDWLGPTPLSAAHALEVAIGLWLMLPIDEWPDSQSLQDYIAHIFPPRQEIPDVPPFPLAFNAYNLNRIGGFDIVWTDNLQDHLSLMTTDQSQKELKIFHLASFLQMYKYSPDSTIFPPGFLEETARTLALLFPASHIECRKWVRRAQRRENIDLEAGLLVRAPRDIRMYHYWGPRLVELKDEYDRTEPTTLRQWMLDKRKPNQRYTFWIAIAALALALIFGLIQSVTGIVQAIHAR